MSDGVPSVGQPATPAPAFRAGDVLTDTLRIWWANAPAFVALSCVLVAPSILFYFLVYQRFLPVPIAGHHVRTPYWLSMSQSSVTMIVSEIAGGVFMVRVAHTLRGRTTSVVDSLQRAIRHLPVLVAVATVVGITTGVGYMFCWVPGALVNAVFAVAVPVAVLEGRGVIGSLERSAELTAGQRWAVFVALFAVGLPTLGISVPIYLLVAAVEHLALRETLRAATPIAYPIAAPFSNGLHATAVGVIYYRLRTKREPMDGVDLARVFD